MKRIEKNGDTQDASPKATESALVLGVLKRFLWLFVLATPLLAQPSPNFVLIFADDLGYWDLSSYGAKAHKTPQPDRMAEGARLTDFRCRTAASRSPGAGPLRNAG